MRANYSIKEIFSSANKKTKLINDNYIKYVKRMFINNTEISPVSYYNFESLGDYVVYILIDISSLNSILSMFKEVKKMASISFTNKFDTRNIKNMNYLFDLCSSLK